MISWTVIDKVGEKKPTKSDVEKDLFNILPSAPRNTDILGTPSC